MEHWNLNGESKYQVITINIKKLCNGLEKLLNFYNDYTGMVLDAKYKSIHGESLKILTPTLAQVKASNTSENLLNEIKKFIYSLCNEKQVTKKYTTI